MHKLGIITILMVGLLALTGTASAKYIPYVEAIEGDWGDMTNPWHMSGGFSTVMYGQMQSTDDVDVLAYEIVQPSSQWLVEAAVPVCGEHFVGFEPIIAVIGEGLPAPTAGAVPFALPEDMGAVIFDEGELVEMARSENYLFTGETERFMRYEADTLLPVGDYFIAIWEPDGQMGAYALSILGIHPDMISVEESARMETSFDLVNSGEWMGQDCSAPVTVVGSHMFEMALLPE